jgi:hypothetical protein
MLIRCIDVQMYDMGTKLAMPLLESQSMKREAGRKSE